MIEARVEVQPGSFLQWSESATPLDPAWDLFVDQSPNGHHEQSTAWGRVKAAYGWSPVRMIARRGNEIAGGAQFLEKKVGKLWKIGYLCQGPVLDFGDPELSREIIRRIDDWGRRRYLYLVVDLPYHGTEIEPLFRNAGFQDNGGLPPSNSFDTTTYINLKDGLSEIFARIGASKRNKLRKSFRTDLRFRRGTSSDVPTFEKLMWQLCELRGSQPNPRQRDFFERIWNEFPEGQAHLYILENPEEAIGSIFAFRSGDWLRCWKVGSSRKDKEKHPNERMWWEAIKAAREQGIRWFDFVWVDRDTALRMKKGEKRSAEWQPESMTAFKMEFGGDLLLMPRQQVKIYSPLLRFVVNAIYPEPLRTLQRFARRFRVRKQ